MTFRLHFFAAAAVAAVSMLLTSTPCEAQSEAQAFTVKVKSHASARAAFRETLGSLRAFGGLRIRSAFADRSDRFVQGAFTATYRGVPVSGVVVSGRTGISAVAFDRQDRAGQTIPPALARLAESMPSGGGAASRPLHTVSFGSGTIGLPDTWQVAESYQGCVEATSTADHGYLAFGCAQAGFAPPVLPGTNMNGVLIAPYADTATMFRDYARHPQPVGLGVAVRVREVKAVPPPVANGESAFILFDYTFGGKPYTGLALVSVMPVDRSSYTFYKSMFMVPADDFPRLAPALWKSWQSWGVSSSVLNARLASAAQSMKETGDIITGAYWDRQHSLDQTSLGFSQTIRDTAQMEDVTTGKRYNGSYFDASTVVQQNPTKYRIVPIGELTP